MKKLILAIALMFALTGVTFAQTSPKKTTTATTTGPKKKDGTPDMRYKTNKEAAKPTTHLKKDGTPDKRYKENKTPKTTPPAK